MSSIPKKSIRPHSSGGTSYATRASHKISPQRSLPTTMQNPLASDPVKSHIVTISLTPSMPSTQIRQVQQVSIPQPTRPLFLRSQNPTDFTVLPQEIFGEICKNLENPYLASIRLLNQSARRGAQQVMDQRFHKTLDARLASRITNHSSGNGLVINLSNMGLTLPYLEEVLNYIIQKYPGTLQNVAVLNLQGNALTQLPANLFQFRNIGILMLNNNFLSQLPENFGRQLGTVNYLSLNNNRLTNLPNTFNDLRAMHVSIDNNPLPIETITANRLKYDANIDRTKECCCTIL